METTGLGRLKAQGRVIGQVTASYGIDGWGMALVGRHPNDDIVKGCEPARYPVQPGCKWDRSITYHPVVFRKQKGGTGGGREPALIAKVRAVSKDQTAQTRSGWVELLRKIKK